MKKFQPKTESIFEHKQISKERRRFASGEVEYISVEKFIPSRFQSRIIFDERELESLSESIKKDGILSPVTARKVDDSTYELIAGERRLRAAKIAKIPTIPTILAGINDLESMSLGLIENIQRQNLSILEEAKAYDRLEKDFGLSHSEIADRTSKSRAQITNIKRVLSMPICVQDLLLYKKLSFGHAKVIMALPEQQMVYISTKIVNENLSVRQTEQLVNKIKNPSEEVNKKDYMEKFYKMGRFDMINISTKKGKIKVEILFDSEEKMQEQLELNI